MVENTLYVIIQVRVITSVLKRQLGLPLLSKERVVYPTRKQRALVIAKSWIRLIKFSKCKTNLVKVGKKTELPKRYSLSRKADLSPRC